MTKIHDCFGKFCETAYLIPAFGGMLPNRIACPLRDHLRGQRHVSRHATPQRLLCHRLVPISTALRK
jgi:hypothetical protein